MGWGLGVGKGSAPGCVRLRAGGGGVSARRGAGPRPPPDRRLRGPLGAPLPGPRWPDGVGRSGCECEYGGPGLVGRIGGQGSNGLPLEQVVGLRLHASHATVPPPIRVGLEFTGERCTWLQGTDPQGRSGSAHNSSGWTRGSRSLTSGTGPDLCWPGVWEESQP